MGATMLRFLGKAAESLFRMLSYPLLFANWLFGAISGENRWIREQQQRMTEGRPPLADADFAARLPMHGEQIRICLAIRDAFAVDCGFLPPSPSVDTCGNGSSGAYRQLTATGTANSSNKLVDRVPVPQLQVCHVDTGDFMNDWAPEDDRVSRITEVNEEPDTIRRTPLDP